MPDERFKKYNAKRAEINRIYQSKKLLQALLILGAAASVITAINLLPNVFNIAVRLVCSVLSGIFAIIFTRIRFVTLEHAKQQKLGFLEQSEPAFHANFR